MDGLQEEGQPGGVVAEGGAAGVGGALAEGGYEAHLFVF